MSDWFWLFVIIVIAAILILFWRVIMMRQQHESNVLEYDGGARRRKNIDTIKDLKAHPRSKSEDHAVKVLEKILGYELPTVNPKWLVWKGKRLELDGYNALHGVAIEFSGPLHTKWFAEKETYTEYFDRIVKDVVKKRLCKKHGVKLIVIDMSLPPRHYTAYMKSRLADAGLMEKQFDYINEQTAEVYRNPQLEAELGLEHEMKRAERV